MFSSSASTLAVWASWGLLYSLEKLLMLGLLHGVQYGWYSFSSVVAVLVFVVPMPSCWINRSVNRTVVELRVRVRGGEQRPAVASHLRVEEKDEEERRWNWMCICVAIHLEKRGGWTSSARISRTTSTPRDRRCSSSFWSPTRNIITISALLLARVHEREKYAIVVVSKSSLDLKGE